MTCCPTTPRRPPMRAAARDARTLESQRRTTAVQIARPTIKTRASTTQVAPGRKRRPRVELRRTLAMATARPVNARQPAARLRLDAMPLAAADALATTPIVPARRPRTAARATASKAFPARTTACSAVAGTRSLSGCVKRLVRGGRATRAKRARVELAAAGPEVQGAAATRDRVMRPVRVVARSLVTARGAAVPIVRGGADDAERVAGVQLTLAALSVARGISWSANGASTTGSRARAATSAARAPLRSRCAARVPPHSRSTPVRRTRCRVRLPRRSAEN